MRRLLVSLTCLAMAVGAVHPAEHTADTVNIQVDFENLHFYGSCGPVTSSGTPKASYNGFVLLDKLANGHRLPLTSSNEPVDGLAALAEDGSLRILLTSFDDADLNTVAPTDVRVAVNWKQMLAKPKATLIRLDKDHGDPHTEFLRLGKPTINQGAEQEQQKALARMIAAAKLTPEEFRDYTAKDGKLAFSLNLNRNSVAYLEFRR